MRVALALAVALLLVPSSSAQQLGKRIEYTITILPDGQIQLRTETVIEENGVEISRLFHREVWEPGRDVSKHSAQRAREVAAVVWTPAVVAAWKKREAERALIR